MKRAILIVVVGLLSVGCAKQGNLEPKAPVDAADDDATEEVDTASAYQPFYQPGELVFEFSAPRAPAVSADNATVKQSFGGMARSSVGHSLNVVPKKKR
jgi:PBP1b-binding outer membrane lipoprotein LpoB